MPYTHTKCLRRAFILTIPILGGFAHGQGLNVEAVQATFAPSASVHVFDTEQPIPCSPSGALDISISIGSAPGSPSPWISEPTVSEFEIWWHLEDLNGQDLQRGRSTSPGDWRVEVGSWGSTARISDFDSGSGEVQIRVHAPFGRQADGSLLPRLHPGEVGRLALELTWNGQDGVQLHGETTWDLLFAEADFSVDIFNPTLYRGQISTLLVSRSDFEHASTVPVKVRPSGVLAGIPSSIEFDAGQDAVLLPFAAMAYGQATVIAGQSQDSPGSYPLPVLVSEGLPQPSLTDPSGDHSSEPIAYFLGQGIGGDLMMHLSAGNEWFAPSTDNGDEPEWILDWQCTPSTPLTSLTGTICGKCSANPTSPENQADCPVETALFTPGHCQPIWITTGSLSLYCYEDFLVEHQAEVYERKTVYTEECWGGGVTAAIRKFITIVVVDIQTYRQCCLYEATGEMEDVILPTCITTEEPLEGLDPVGSPE